MVFETNGRLVTILNYTFEKVVKYYNIVKVLVEEYKRQVKRFFFFFKRTLKHADIYNTYTNHLYYCTRITIIIILLR